MLGCSCTLFNKKETFNTKYPQLLVAKDFAVAEKKLHLTVSRRKNTTQEKRHLRKDIPQMLKQQIPNHQLHKIGHKTNPSLNSSHKMSPSLNSSHKARPPLNNNHKAKQLILSRLNPVMTIHHFQIMPQLSKLL